MCPVLFLHVVVQMLSCDRGFVTPMDCSTPGFPVCPSLSPGACSNSCPLSWRCYPTISVVPFSSCPQSFPASGSFLMIRSSHQVAKILALQLQHPMNIQDWFSLEWTSLISLQSKGLSKAFSNTTVQKHQFFSAQLSLWSNSQFMVQSINTLWVLVNISVSVSVH